MKTYKEIISEAKASGESPRRDKEFKDKHVIQKINHPVAGDDQFGAPNIKKDKTKHASHHDGEDALVYEEVEQLDELSQDTLWKYHGNAGADLLKKREKLAKGTLTSAELKKGQNRVKGLKRAADKMHEEMSDAEMKKREDLVKGMKKNKEDFKKRYGDRWKSVMYATATKNAMKESVELDEISKKTLGSYINKASHDKAANASKMGDGNISWHKDSKRTSGIARAVKKLTKEEYMDETFKAGPMKLANSSSVKVTTEQATALNALFKELNPSNQKKMQERLMRDAEGFNEILAFAKAAL